VNAEVNEILDAREDAVSRMTKTIMAMFTLSNVNKKTLIGGWLTAHNASPGDYETLTYWNCAYK
jgi:hypothetical protein